MLCHFLWHSCDSAAERKQGTNPKMALSLEMFGSFFICLFWWEFCTPLNSNTPTHVGWIYPAACCVTGNLCLPPSPCSVTPSVTPSPCSVTPLHPLPSLTPVNVNPPSQVPPDPTLSAPVTGLLPALFALKLKIWMHFPQVFEKPIQLPLMSDGEKYFQIGIWEMGTEALCHCVANFISCLFSILCLRKIWLA